jgi:hypothetical protein
MERKCISSPFVGALDLLSMSADVLNNTVKWLMMGVEWNEVKETNYGTQCLVGIRNELHKTDSGFMFHFIKYIRFQVHFIEYNRIHKLVYKNWGFI